MAATPTYANVVFFNPQTKEKISRSAYLSDVTTQHWTWEDGGNALIVPAGFTIVVDICTSSNVVDCRTSTIRVNNVQIGRIVANNTCNGTIVNRPFQICPLAIPSGASLDFVQVT